MRENYHKADSVKKNAVMSLILTVSTMLFPIISFPYAARVLTPVGTGRVSFAVSFISYFSMIAQLGIPTYGIRACARVRDDKTELTRVVHELLLINLAMDVVSYVALIISLLFVPRLQEDKMLYILVSLTIVLTSIGVEWLYKALEQYKYITIRSLVFKLISLISLFLLVHSQDDYIVYGGITIFAASASNILNFINIRKYIYLKSVGNYNFKRHFKAVFTFFAMACAVTVYTNLDMVMLGFMKTDADVGYYNAAIKIKSILVSVVTSIGAVLLPRSSYYIERGELDKFREVSKKALIFVFFAAIPTFLYFIIYAKEGILFLSGSAYYPAINPMKVIMPTVLFIGITNIFGIQMLIPLGKENQVLYSEIIGAVVDLILNLILIPRFGALGAAIGTLIAEFAVLLYQLRAISDERKYLSVNKSIVRYLVVAIASAILCLWVKGIHVSNFFALCLSAITMFGFYALCLLLLKDDMIQEIFSKKLEKN
ncbi:MAG: flippase [Lachnospiraceae bacterium]|nr:flippase [Lachnospiraceae bacterium]